MNNKRIDYIAVGNCNLTSRHSVAEIETYAAKSDTIQHSVIGCNFAWALGQLWILVRHWPGLGFDYTCEIYLWFLVSDLL